MTDTPATTPIDASTGASPDAKTAGSPDTAWLTLLDEMQLRAPEFVDRFLAELREQALYDPESVPPGDLERAAEETVLMFIDRLRTGQITRADSAEPLGRRRARQGVPLERLMQAIRLDLRIMWQILLDIAHPDRTDVLVRHVEQLIAVVDAYVADVQQAFLREVAILQRDSRLVTEQHLSKLFNAQSLTPALLDAVAAGIGVGPKERFEMLMLPGDSSEVRGSKVDPWLAKPNVFAYMYRGWLMLFRPHNAPLSTWPKEFAPVPSVYVDAVDGLDRVPGAARALIDLHASAPPLHALTYVEDLWVFGAANYLETLLPGHFSSILESLSQLGEDEQERLLRTVRAYLESGSVKVTAHVVDCHRNTVINRFRLFQTHTGLDITVPSQAALALVLLSGADTAEARNATATL
ncbi:helix-turn-helix domain-containing protein [Leucobacter sp. Z1108]|uniref:helix-turn-helix domain-containing protein n=1 Tax=Leucobacter sp. Z1108 TaxID=3439066 RepID=UPI003F35D71D